MENYFEKKIECVCGSYYIEYYDRQCNRKNTCEIIRNIFSFVFHNTYYSNKGLNLDISVCALISYNNFWNYYEQL